MNAMNYQGYHRVNKRVARKLYDQGERIWLCACNMMPFTGWHVECPIEKKEESDEYYNRTFDDVVNNFQYYNCSHEEGDYASYYVKDKVSKP